VRKIGSYTSCKGSAELAFDQRFDSTSVFQDVFVRMAGISALKLTRGAF
jgi:hypothetical protein